MAAFIRKLFTPARPDYKIFMSGLDAAGKTTILYKLKLGEVVTTIPTIGFNVETLDYKGFKWTTWDVGGCDKIRPLYRHYFANTNALIFVIDSTDHDRLTEALEELERGVVDLLETVRNVDESGRPSVDNAFAGVAVLLNKQDLPGAMTLDFVEERMTPIRKRAEAVPGGGVEWTIRPVCATSGDGLHEVLEWFNGAMAKVQPVAKKTCAKQQTPFRPDQMPPVEELRGRINSINDSPEDPEVFFQQFCEGTVTPFDHRAHLRAGYLILLRARRKGMRDPKAVDEFINALENFFAKAGSRLRNTFHITMTVFWCHAVHAGITSYEHHLKHLPLDIDFPRFLIHNPHLMWSGLWTKHYTKDHIFNKNAASRFVLPDKKPLDSYVVLHDAATIVQSMQDGAQPITKGKISPVVMDSGESMTDEVFWKKFEAGMLEIFGKTDLVRVAYLTVKGARVSGERRGVAVKRSMEQLQSLLIRLRAQNPASEQFIPAFSETQFYFWVQTVDATAVDQDVQILNLSFRSFASLFPEILRDDLWKEYYSEKVWESTEARLQFVVPDVKPLPSRVQRRDVDAVADAVGLDQRPTISELKERAVKIVNDLEGFDDEEFLKAVVDGKLPRFGHGALLRLVWLHIRRVKDAGERRSLGTSRILDGIDAFFANRVVESGVGLSEGEWKSHKGLTYVTFWIQMVTGALVGARRVASFREFAGFLDGAPELIWESLWTLYYSPDVMESFEGKALFVPADRRKLPSYIV